MAQRQQLLPTARNLVHIFRDLPPLEDITAEVQRRLADLDNYTEQYLAVDRVSQSGLLLGSMYLDVFDRVKVRLSLEKDTMMELLNETLKPLTEMLDESYKDWCWTINAARGHTDHQEREISTVQEVIIPPLGPTFVMMLNKMHSIHDFIQGTRFECERDITPEYVDRQRESLECWMEEIQKAYRIHQDMIEQAQMDVMEMDVI